MPSLYVVLFWCFALLIRTADDILAPSIHFKTYSYALPGNLYTIDNSSIPAIAHFFLKATAYAYEVHLDGVLYIESVSQTELYAGYLFKQPDEVQGWLPQLQLLGKRYHHDCEPADKAWAFNSSVTAWQPRRESSASWPYRLNATLAVEHALWVNTLRFSGVEGVASWSRHLLVDDVLANPQQPPQHTQRHIRVVLQPIVQLTPARAAYFLATHVQWHRGIGANDTLLYTGLGAGRLLLKHAKVAALHRQGSLHMLHWSSSTSGFAAHRGTRRSVKFDQSIIYNHAVLAHLHTNTWLLLLDLDEYLAISQPVPLPQIMEDGCLQGIDIARIKRRDVYMGDIFAAGGSELEVWDAMQGMLALQRYSHRSLYIDRSKSLVQPEAVRAFHVHMSEAQPGFNAQLADEQCVFVAHTTHLLQHRFLDATRLDDKAYRLDHSPQEYVQDTSWLWPTTNCTGC